MKKINKPIFKTITIATLLTLLCVAFPASPTQAETLSLPLSISGDYIWAKGIGGTSDDQGYGIVTDSSGNIYTTGYFSSTVDFDPGNGVFELVSSNLSQDIYISKLNNQGNLVWAKQIGQAGTDFGFDITVDASGYVYVTGIFSAYSNGNTVDFDPGVGTLLLTSAGEEDVFVIKLDSNGNLIWAKSMGGADGDDGLGIAVDSNGNVFTTGYFSFPHTGIVSGPADFDPGNNTFNLTSAGMSDIFISKLDSMGNFVWAKRMGGAGANGDKSLGIALDLNGNVYTTGYFENSIDFDPGVGVFNLTNGGILDIFLSKLDNNGNFVWAKGIGGAGVDIGNRITLDSIGNIYTTGTFSGDVDFDPGLGISSLTSVGGLDIFISKFNSNGELVWAKGMGGSTSDQGRGIAIDSVGNVYTTGQFLSNTIDFDPGPGSYILTNTSGTSSNIFISNLNSSGDFVWAKSMGSTTNNSGTDITFDNNGNLFTTGAFSGTVDFDPGAGVNNLTSAGSLDIFITTLGGKNIISGPTDADVTIAGVSRGTYPMVPETSQPLQYTLDGGPVVISSNNGMGIVASLNQWRRPTPYGGWTGVAQSMALPIEQISNSYVIPRYNGTDPTLYNAVLMANVDNVPRTITVKIGGTTMGSYLLGPSDSRFEVYNVTGGPLVVSSVTGAKIVASLYELKRAGETGEYNGQSEMMGLSSSQLSDKVLIPIYFGNWPLYLNASLYFANADTFATTVEVKIAGVSRGTYSMPPDTSMVVQYTLDGGPVEISSNNGAKVVASLNQWRRPTPYGGWTGVAQSMALPIEQISNSYVIPRYNGTDPTLYNAVLMANVDNVPRTITVKIGGTTMGSYLLGPSDSRFEVYNVTAGPLVVSSDMGSKIVASLYELKRAEGTGEYNGQSEMMGLTMSQLSDRYLIPIYFGNWGNYLNASLYIGVP